ncbi:unnamed protein product [Coregonus sp. 'balchen']|nr:unnamed protein product [Coregonus sp. 'balchen']
MKASECSPSYNLVPVLPAFQLPAFHLPAFQLPAFQLPAFQTAELSGNLLKWVPYSVCPVFDGESLFIKILVNQCPESEISFRTQRKGSVFTYDKEKDMCTVGPRYGDRIQMKNDSNGRVFEFRNVTKEDMDERYVIYASNTPHQRFGVLRVQPPQQPPNHLQPHQEVYLRNIWLGWY